MLPKYSAEIQERSEIRFCENTKVNNISRFGSSDTLKTGKGSNGPRLRECIHTNYKEENSIKSHGNERISGSLTCRFHSCSKTRQRSLQSWVFLRLKSMKPS